MTENTDLLRYPIGKFEAPKEINISQIESWISIIEALPAKLRDAVADLSDEQLDTPYRPGGWTLRQVVHHIPDSHMNAYIRFKLAITEDNPTILPYKEDRWAELEDGKGGPIAVSLDMIESLHNRWTIFLKSLKEEDFNRTYFHPEHQKKFTLNVVLAMYAWHSEHHLQHIIKTREHNNWQR